MTTKHHLLKIYTFWYVSASLFTTFRMQDSGKFNMLEMGKKKQCLNKLQSYMIIVSKQLFCVRIDRWF